MGFWIPQNLQRRLLLHVLQQISIFSNLDLSNLDISLGSNSKFSFTDIDLHVSEIFIPYFDVKSGSVSQLDLKLNVSGGLEASGKGIHFTFIIKPEEITPEDISFSLSKSIQNLTTSIIQFSTEDVLTNKEADILKKTLEENNLSNTKPEKGLKNDKNNNSDNNNSDIPGTFVYQDHGSNEETEKLTTLQTMRNKVLNALLSKLTIILQDITIGIEDTQGHLQYEITLEGISLMSREDNIWQISMKDFSVVHHKVYSEAREESNTDSNIFDSKYSEGSIYMSALGSISKPTETMPSTGLLKLFSVDQLQMSFQGLNNIEDTSISNITIDINRVDIIPFNFVQLNDNVCLYLIKLIKKLMGAGILITESDNFKMEPVSAKEPKHKKKENNLLSFCCIKSLFLGLDEENNIQFEQLYLNQTDNGDCMINIDNLKTSGSDIKIKIEKKPILKGVLNHNLTEIMLNSHLDMKMNKKSLQLLLGIFNESSKWLNKYIFQTTRNYPKKTAMKNLNEPSSENKNFKVTGKSVSLSIQEEDYILSIVLNPFLYDQNKMIVNSDKLFGLLNDGKKIVEIFSLNNIVIQLFEQKQKFATYNEMMQKVFSLTKCTINIENAYIHLLQEQLDIILSTFVPLIKSINNKDNSKDYHKRVNCMRKSVRILSSLNVKRKESMFVNQIIFIKSIKYRLKNILKDTSFGSIKGKLLENMIIFPCIGDEIIFISESIDMKRVLNGHKVTENIFSSIPPTKIKKPNLYLQMISQENGTKFRVKLINIELRYRARWLNILRELRSVSNKKFDNESQGMEEGYQSKPSFDITFIESALLLQPYRLKTCLLVTFDHMVNNCEFTDHMNINSVLKNGNILLIDEFKGSKRINVPRVKDVTSFYITDGFSLIGRSKNMRIQTNNVIDMISMKFNLDHLSLLLCGDSFNAMIQTCIDLKYPETFPDERKYQTSFKEDINVMDNIDFEFFNKINTDINDPEGDSQQVNFNIVEDFLDHDSSEQEFVRTTNSIDDSGNDNNSDLPSIKIESNYIDKQNNFEILSIDKNKPFSLPPSEDFNVSISLQLSIKKCLIKLFDGYDWVYSRKIISKEIEKLGNSSSIEPEEINLFQSIYIQPNPDVNISQAITNTIQGIPRDESNSSPPINLHPSRTYKLLIDMDNVSIKVQNFNVDSGTIKANDKSFDYLNRVLIEVDTFEIIDNLETSTWNKIATILRHEHWSVNDPMFAFALDMIRPLNYLEALEYILRVKSCPLRLHLDRSTIDFLIRFIQFKDLRFELVDDYPDKIFIQKVAINPIKLVVDYKPHRVDYLALKSGHTSELMNLFTINGSSIILKRIESYGINGFDCLFKELIKQWGPDILKRQIGGVLSGITPLKTFISLGSGVKTLVTVLKSGSSNSFEGLATNANDDEKGEGEDWNGNIFLKTSTGKFIKLSLGMINGTQTILENTEAMFGGLGSKARGKPEADDTEQERVRSSRARVRAKDDDDLLHVNHLLKEDQLIGVNNKMINGHGPRALIIDSVNDDTRVRPRIISLYADQPLTIHEGLEDAYHSLEKHIQIAYDTVWQNDVESNRDISAAAISVAKVAPIAIIRPLIGATEAISKTLQGMANTLDKDNIEEIRDKYKLG